MVINCCKVTKEVLYCCSRGRGSWCGLGILLGNAALGYWAAWVVDGWKGSRGIAH